jgi:hypothetical protein
MLSLRCALGAVDLADGWGKSIESPPRNAAIAMAA